MTTPTNPAGPQWSAMFSTVYVFPLTRACARERELPTVHFIADHRGPRFGAVSVPLAGRRDSRLRAASAQIVAAAATGRGDARARWGRQG